MNSLNEDIKIIEKKIELSKRSGVDKTLSQAIESLLKSYKNLQEIEQYHKAENGKLKESLAEHERLNAELIKVKANDIGEHINNEYIHISKIKELILNPMIEEYNKAIEGFMKRDITQCAIDGEIAQELGYFIGKIEDLLKGG